MAQHAVLQAAPSASPQVFCPTTSRSSSLECLQFVKTHFCDDLMQMGNPTGINGLRASRRTSAGSANAGSSNGTLSAPARTPPSVSPTASSPTTSPSSHRRQDHPRRPVCQRAQKPLPMTPAYTMPPSSSDQPGGNTLQVALPLPRAHVFSVDQVTEALRLIMQPSQFSDSFCGSQSSAEPPLDLLELDSSNGSEAFLRALHPLIQLNEEINDLSIFDNLLALQGGFRQSSVEPVVEGRVESANTAEEAIDAVIDLEILEDPVALAAEVEEMDKKVQCGSADDESDDDPGDYGTLDLLKQALENFNQEGPVEPGWHRSPEQFREYIREVEEQNKKLRCWEGILAYEKMLYDSQRPLSVATKRIVEVVEMLRARSEALSEDARVSPDTYKIETLCGMIDLWNASHTIKALLDLETNVRGAWARGIYDFYTATALPSANPAFFMNHRSVYLRLQLEGKPPLPEPKDQCFICGFITLQLPQ